MALTRPRGPDRERWLVVAAVAFLAIVPAPVARAAEQGLSVNCIVQLGVMATALAQQSTCKANMTGVQSLTYQGILDRATSLVSKCLDSNLTDLRPVNGLFNADGADLFASLAPVLQSKSGFALRSVVAADTAAVMAEVLQQLNNRISSVADIYYIGSPYLIDMIDNDGGFGFVDITEFISEDNSILDWQDVHPYYRGVSSVYDGKIITIPFTNLQLYLYHRMDIFARFNLTVPVTWDEFLDVAQRLNGTDFNGDGVPDPSLCMATGASSLHPNFLMAVFASLVQTSGSSQGVLWDPATMEPLVGTVAMEEALHVMQTWQRFNIRTLTPYSWAADLSACAMSISPANVYKLSAIVNRNVRGRLGVSILPGSAKVLDRSTMSMVQCTPRLCSDVVTDAAGRSISINRAPTPGFGAISMAINPWSPRPIQISGYRIIAAACSNDVQGSLVAYNPSRLTPYGPIRLSQMDTTPAGISRWTNRGFHINDTRQFLTATLATLNHPNVVGNIAIKGMQTFITIMDEEVFAMMMQGQSITTTLQRMDQRFRRQMDAFTDPARVAASYRTMLKFSFSPPVPPPPAPPPLPRPPGADASASGDSSSSTSIVLPVTVASAGAALGILVVATLFVVHVRHKRRAHRSLLGSKVVAPGLGPDTTLLITDVEGSTQLFELMPDAMDRAMVVHNAALGDVMDKHTGYCSASEGDGWVVAFHSAVDALQAACELQEALLHADWPTQLLEHPSTAARWLSLAPATATENLRLWMEVLTLARQGGSHWKGTHTILALAGKATAPTGAGGVTSQFAISRSGISVTSPPMRPSLGLRAPMSNLSLSGAADAQSRPERISSASQAGPPSTQQLTSNSQAWRQRPDAAGGASLARMVVTGPAGAADAEAAYGVGPSGSLSSLQSWWLHTFALLGENEVRAAMASGTSPSGALPDHGSLKRVYGQASGETTSPFVIRAQLSGPSFTVSGTLPPVEPDAHGEEEEEGGEEDRGQPNQDQGDLFSLSPRSARRSSRAGDDGDHPNVAQSFVGWLAGVKSVVRVGFPSTLGQAGLGPRHCQIKGSQHVLVYRGLRVRAGLHSGLHDALFMCASTSTNRVQYGGEFLALAHAVSSAANGGSIIVSQHTFAQVAWASLAPELTVLAAGEHKLQLSGNRTPLVHDIYEVLPHDLAFRALVAKPLRTLCCTQPGYHSAPFGQVTVAYFQAIGVPTLMAWDPLVARKSIALMQEVACALLVPFRGYLLDSSENLGVLAAFHSAKDAICWALVTKEALLHAEWPEELLDNPLGEEVGVEVGPLMGVAQRSITRRTMVLGEPQAPARPPTRTMHGQRPPSATSMRSPLGAPEHPMLGFLQNQLSPTARGGSAGPAHPLSMPKLEAAGPWPSVRRSTSFRTAAGATPPEERGPSELEPQRNGRNAQHHPVTAPGLLDAGIVPPVAPPGAAAVSAGTTWTTNALCSEVEPAPGAHPESPHLTAEAAAAAAVAEVVAGIDPDAQGGARRSHSPGAPGSPALPLPLAAHLLSSTDGRASPAHVRPSRTSVRVRLSSMTTRDAGGDRLSPGGTPTARNVSETGTPTLQRGSSALMGTADLRTSAPSQPRHSRPSSVIMRALDDAATAVGPEAAAAGTGPAAASPLEEHGEQRERGELQPAAHGDAQRRLSDAAQAVPPATRHPTLDGAHPAATSSGAWSSAQLPMAPAGMDAVDERAAATTARPPLSSSMRLQAASGTLSASRHRFSVDDRQETADSQGQDPTGDNHTLLMRGLRVRCGIDVGAVRTGINDISGRITYVGKVMNRAARIAGVVKSGHVWASAEAYNSAVRGGRPEPKPSSRVVSREASAASLSQLIRGGQKATRPSFAGLLAHPLSAQHAVPDQALAGTPPSSQPGMPLLAHGPQPSVLPAALPLSTNSVPQGHAVEPGSVRSSSAAGSTAGGQATSAGLGAANLVSAAELPSYRQLAHQALAALAPDRLTSPSSVQLALRLAAAADRRELLGTSLGPYRLKSMLEETMLVECELGDVPSDNEDDPPQA